MEPRDRGQNPEHFFRLATRAQRKHHVAVGDHAQISMKRVGRIQHNRGRAGARERRRDLSPNVSGFANAYDDNFPSGIDCFLNHLNGAREIFIQPVPEPLELENF